MILVPPPRGLRIWQNFELVSSNTIHPKFKLIVLLRRFGWLCNEVCLFLVRCTRCKRWLGLPADGEDWVDGPAKDILSLSLRQNTSLMLPWSIWKASSSSIIHPSSSTNLMLVLMSNFVFAFSCSSSSFDAAIILSTVLSNLKRLLRTGWIACHDKDWKIDNILFSNFVWRDSGY